jgi:hypothetical protein
MLNGKTEFRTVSVAVAFPGLRPSKEIPMLHVAPPASSDPQFVCSWNDPFAVEIREAGWRIRPDTDVVPTFVKVTDCCDEVEPDSVEKLSCVAFACSPEVAGVIVKA